MGCCIQWLAYVIMPVSHVVKQTQTRIYQKQKRVQSPRTELPIIAISLNAMNDNSLWEIDEGGVPFYRSAIH